MLQILLTVSIAFANDHQTLSLPPIFASGMVLQQADSVTIWGSGKQNSRVVVKTGWERTRYRAMTNPAGKWSLKIATPSASFTPYEISISAAGEKIILKDILIGDVWFLSGQSNMYESFMGYTNQPVYRAQDILMDSNISGIRLFKVQSGSSVVETEKIEGAWQYCIPENVRDFSAVGFVFGKTVFDQVKIPVGLVQCAYSGSLAEAWLDIESLREFGGVKLDDIRIIEGLGTSMPTLQYNKMLKPLLPLTIKGAIWYQGEANVKSPPGLYERLFPFLITKWREYFDKPLLPFYYVQIAPFSYDYAPGLESQYIREAQLKTLNSVENVGMAVTLDIGSYDSIHPSEKELVGKRLAYWALNKTYHIEYIACRGPELQTMKIRKDKINLFFDHAPNGLSSFGNKLDGFEIAGEDRIFHMAEANILIVETDDGWKGAVQVKSEKVPQPVAVRYGFTNYTHGTLYNTEGLPASSFRTDDW